MAGTLEPTKISKDYFKPHSKITIGCLANQALMKLMKNKSVSDRDLLSFRMDFQKFCVRVISKIVDKSPLAYKTARDLSCLDPDNFSKESSGSKFQSLAKDLHIKRWLSADEVDEAVFQYKTLRGSVVQETTAPKESRLDERYRCMNFEIMPALRKVIDLVLTLSHGNAQVEWGFSVNKEVSVDNMAERTLIAKRLLICQFVRDKGSPATVTLTKNMLSSCSGAYQKYKAVLEEQAKAKEVGEKEKTKKRKAEEVKEMCAKKRKLEIDVDLLIRKADDLADEAEQKGSSAKAHQLLVESNALRKDAKAKKVDLENISTCIQSLEGELALL